MSINRPKALNAFRPLTIDELRTAFQDAWDDDQIGVIVLGGSGHFCVGGDVKVRGQGGYKDAAGKSRLQVTLLHRLIREIPKPVIAMVDGYAIGGGHVLHVLCDLTIASTDSLWSDRSQIRQL
jgi:naphthoate synthase